MKVQCFPYFNLHNIDYIYLPRFIMYDYVYLILFVTFINLKIVVSGYLNLLYQNDFLQQLQRHVYVRTRELEDSDMDGEQ